MVSLVFNIRKKSSHPISMRSILGVIEKIIIIILKSAISYLILIFGSLFSCLFLFEDSHEFFFLIGFFCIQSLRIFFS